jgi:spermidine synthase
MKPTVKLASTTSPDGGEISLYQHDRDFIIRAGNRDLMTSRQHESELELGRLGCSRLADNRNAVVLIGGLGMGYTLRAVLDSLSPKAVCIVAELLPAVIQWNRDFLGELAGHPLRDPRVILEARDVRDVIGEAHCRFDSIILDVDNGPGAMTSEENHRLYSRGGIEACCRALHAKGRLAVWSASPDKRFERRLQQARLNVRRFSVPAYRQAKSQYRTIWVASAFRGSLPDAPDRAASPQR